MLLPGILQQQISYFEKEASTLDVLIGGWRMIEQEKIIEYKPWENFSDIENLHFKQVDFIKTFLDNSAIMLRRRTFEILDNFSQEKKSDMIENLSKIISSKRCRILCLKLIAFNHYKN